MAALSDFPLKTSSFRPIELEDSASFLSSNYLLILYILISYKKRKLLLFHPGSRIINGKNLYCNGCFAAGINFAASLVSLFYGEGDLVETIKIGSLAGWDSDNPTATWGGLIGFMIGKDGIEEIFDRTFSDKFNIHRTRQNFPNDGIDSFDNMAKRGLSIIDRVIKEEIGGTINIENNAWIIPQLPRNKIN